MQVRKERKRAQKRAHPRKNCKQPGLKQPGLGTLGSVCSPSNSSPEVDSTELTRMSRSYSKGSNPPPDLGVIEAERGRFASFSASLSLAKRGSGNSGMDACAAGPLFLRLLPPVGWLLADASARLVDNFGEVFRRCLSLQFPRENGCKKLHKNPRHFLQCTKHSSFVAATPGGTNVP